MDCCTCTSDVWSRQGLSQLSPVDGSTISLQQVWSSGFLHCGSDGMEQVSWLSPGRSSVYQQLQIGSEYSSFFNTVGTSSTFEALGDALYKSTTTTVTTTNNHNTTTWEFAHYCFCPSDKLTICRGDRVMSWLISSNNCVSVTYH